MKLASACVKLVLLTALHALSAATSASDTRATGRVLSQTMERKASSRQKDYGTTIPLQLQGREWKPVHELRYKIHHPSSLKLQIEVEGERLLLNLEKNHGLFASSYSETHYQEDGSSVTGRHNFTINCYYHGEVEGREGSDVTLSTCDGVRGFLSLADRSFVLEPSSEHSDGTHWVYSAQHLQLPRGTCGHEGLNMSSRISSPSAPAHTDPTQDQGNVFRAFSTRNKRHAQTTTKYVELIIVADNREFQKQGKDVERVKQRLAEIANYVDKFYRALNIRVALVGLEVWSDVDKCPVTQDPFTTLHEFLDWRKVKLLPVKPHDNAQLISGVYFQGTTIGMAPIMSMCTAEQSGGIVMLRARTSSAYEGPRSAFHQSVLQMLNNDHSDNPLGAAVTLAHELGHNFGMNHDTPERGCGCRVTVDRGGCIMTPSTGYPFPTIFSSCSKKDLSASLEKGVGMCLFNMPEIKVLYGGQKCGNGYVEEGEECDCGEPEECLNPCCNATTCTLKGDSVCAHGQCCHDCQLKRAGTPCRESGNSCDLPEFCTGTSPHCPANVYLHDGHACLSVDGYCYNGICQTHEQQCVTLWGQGAKAAPGICFERVNSAGDPYGNCGKDNKGLFAKCEPRDAKCGKIQCQGGASRPVIGTNAVSIETNIPLQEGGRILCRGTHVYLGDDMPDPGLVLTGTKCGNSMMCLNRQCQNVSVFGVHQCAAKCSSRGVCNNNKNCHCEAHWAPPFCDKSGFGGSVDSGPIRIADHSSVMALVLVALLSLLGATLVFCLKRKSLLGLLFTDNKGPLEKLRSVSAGLSGANPNPNPAPPASSTVSPSRPPKPQTSSIFEPESASSPAPYPSHSLRRLPQCPPVPLSITLSLSPGPVQPRPPLPPPHRAPPPRHAELHPPPHRAPPPPHRAPPPHQLRGVSVRSVPRHRMVMELEKPSPPQKPLPADPRGVRLIRGPSVNQAPSSGASSVPGHSAAFGVNTEGPRPLRPTPHTNRSSPKHPVPLPKPCLINIKYS
uniref:Disintegrin and metalloproteinase domain-containing protein 12 n=1 Tax=Knipowitschia caucasica TaxID=637954 RepID=A0AAV2LHQ5_KNICA